MNVKVYHMGDGYIQIPEKDWDEVIAELSKYSVIEDRVLNGINSPSCPKCGNPDISKNMKYIAYVKQQDEGCDYTIGCAQTLWHLDATTRDGARNELKRKILGDWSPDEIRYYEGYWDEMLLASVVLYEVSFSEDIPVERWYQEGQERIKQAQREIEDVYDRQEFARLQQKFSTQKEGNA